MFLVFDIKKTALTERKINLKVFETNKLQGKCTNLKIARDRSSKDMEWNSTKKRILLTISFLHGFAYFAMFTLDG